MSETRSTGTKKATAGKTAAKKSSAGKPEQTASVKTPLNLRKGPGYDCAVIRVLQEKEKLFLIGAEKNGFCTVRTKGGEEGWVCTDFIEVTDGV